MGIYPSIYSGLRLAVFWEKVGKKFWIYRLTKLSLAGKDIF
jgi:hypothetical protein